ncbi:hypothetical protein AMJ44_14270 [candidate division WOR-1 bacterium DG_54_3]|uniref:Uncharacterized protein n=1 Tax=candidate division WOR-1 bacterium DG_54_3 TaxID=1703775 RepID=A0A0S7XM91_UNCSA|nr:MAG: hypothetical protein AMJ44_14270 [candidate division WOR-1 bacterium DG_54_3]
MREFLPLTVVTSIIIFLWGCAPAPPVTTGRPLKDEKIIRIQPGKTTKGDIIEWFGAPMAIAVQGEILKIQTEASWAKGNPRGGYYFEIDSDTFFELFSSKHELTEYHRIYYYYRAVSTKSAVILLLYFYESGRTVIDRLWILVNEETGIVEDYVFRKY